MSRHGQFRPGGFAVARLIYFHRLAPGENPDEGLGAPACDRKVDDRVEFDFADFKTHYEFFLPMTGV